MLKKKSTYIIALLTVILCSFILFATLVHVPYVNRQNNLSQIKNKIMSEGHILEADYFNEYNSSESYYILMNSKYAYVYDSSYNRIARKKVDSLYIEETKNLFASENFSKIEVEYGFENDKLCYVYKLSTDQQITYRYYNLETGQLMKTYSIRK